MIIRLGARSILDSAGVLRLPLSINSRNQRCLHVGAARLTKLYSNKHEWVELVGGADSDTVRVGMTRYAADSLGDVVFAQLPREAEEVGLGAECGAVESVKAASDLYSPVTGTVIRHNTQVEDKPGLINSSPEEEAWLFELNLSNRIELRSLMDKEGYDNFLKSVTDDLE